MNILKIILAAIGLLFVGIVLLWALGWIGTLLSWVFWLGLIGLVVCWAAAAPPALPHAKAGAPVDTHLM